MKGFIAGSLAGKGLQRLVKCQLSTAKDCFLFFCSKKIIIPFDFINKILFLQPINIHVGCFKG